MMKLLKTFFVGILMTISVFPCLWAKSGATSADFLKLPVGARAASLGEAFVGLANDSNAIFVNPAGITTMSWTEISATYNSWIEGVSVGNLSLCVPFDKESGMGIGVTYLNSGSIEQTDITKNITGSYTSGGMAASAGYAMKAADNLSLGAAVKYISEKIDSESGTGFAADLGGLYSAKFGEIPVSIGAAATDFGQKMGPGEKSDLPSALRGGAAVNVVKDVLTFSAEYTAYQKSDAVAGIGAEYLLSNIFTVRLGYKLLRKDLSGMEPVTAGFGIIYTEKYDFMLDYAFGSMGAIGQAHRISVGMRL